MAFYSFVLIRSLALPVRRSWNHSALLYYETFSKEMKPSQGKGMGEVIFTLQGDSEELGYLSEFGAGVHF